MKVQNTSSEHNQNLAAGLVTRTIDVADFVDLNQIAPIYYDRTCWLAPEVRRERRPTSGGEAAAS